MAAKINDKNIALLVVVLVVAMFLMGAFAQKAAPTPTSLTQQKESVAIGIATLQVSPPEAQMPEKVAKASGTAEITILPNS